MRFFCNNCDQKLDTKHFWEGVSVTCPNCGKPTKLKYREGQSIPGIEYSITFSDFEQLLSYEPYSKTIDPIIEKLLECKIERNGKKVKLVKVDGSLIPMEAAHFEIQMNSESQGTIYRAAMSLWR